MKSAINACVNIGQDPTSGMNHVLCPNHWSTVMQTLSSAPVTCEGNLDPMIIAVMHFMLGDRSDQHNIQWLMTDLKLLHVMDRTFLSTGPNSSYCSCWEVESIIAHQQSKLRFRQGRRIFDNNAESTVKDSLVVRSFGKKTQGERPEAEFELNYGSCVRAACAPY